LGVLLFTIVFGENPFQNKDEIMEGKYVFPSKIDPGKLSIKENGFL